MNRKMLMIFFIFLTLVLSTSVCADDLTTTEQGVVNGGVYTHAVQKTPYSQQSSGGNLEEVSFNITKEYESNTLLESDSNNKIKSTDDNSYNDADSDKKNIKKNNVQKSLKQDDSTITDVQSARLYTMVYVQSTNNKYGALVNVSLDGDNDGVYETILENNRLLQIASSTDGTVYTVNENITRVYSDYLLSYNIAKYIKSDTINVKVQTYSGDELYNADAKIKCIGLAAAYNVTTSDKEYKYWFNSGHSWTNDLSQTTFATKGTPAEKVILTQVATSSAKSDTYFNGITLDVVEPSNYFSENVWDVSDLYDDTEDILLENEPTGGLYGASYKTILASIVISNTVTVPTAEVSVSKFAVSSNSGDALVYVNNTLQATLSNSGTELENAKLTLNVDDYSQTVDVANLGTRAKRFNFNYVTNEKGTKTVSLVIDYLNGTTEILYTGELEVKYNGYMGKSFTEGENFTTKRIYEGLNTLNIIPVHEYKSASWQNFTNTIDATEFGLTDQSKLVDVLYYQGYNWDYGYVLNTYQLQVNNQLMYPIANYNDTKGFGAQWDFPSGVIVYNISSAFKANEINEFNITRNTEDNLALYTGYIVAIYENSTRPSIIKINEETDLLNTESSGYGTNSTTAIVYSIYDDINTKYLNSASLCVISGAANFPESNVFLNDKRYGSMSDGFNVSQQQSFSIYDVDNIIDGQNIVKLQSVDDNLVVLGSILTINYDEPLINVNSVSVTSNSNTLLANENNNIKVTLGCEQEHSAVNVTLKVDDEEITQTIDKVDTVQTIDFNYIPITDGTKNIEIIIGYLNNTNISTYSGELTVYYNGYMGKSYTNEGNFTIKRQYDGKYSLTLIPITEYQGATWKNFSSTVDITKYGIIDSEKIIDVLYYIPYNWDANNASNTFTITVNNQSVGDAISQYYDRKGFGGWDYPSGLLVYNITDSIKDESNTFNFIRLTNDQVALYGSFIAIIYENETKSSKILITEDADLLCAGSSGYGADKTTAISYAIYDDIDLTNIKSTSLYVISASANEASGSIIYINNKEYSAMYKDYNNSGQISLTYLEPDNIINGQNIISMQSTNDNLVTYATILVLTEPEINIIVDDITFSKTQDAILTYNNTTVTVALSNDGSVCDEANVIVTIGNESKTNKVYNLGNTPQDIVYDFYFTNKGTQDVTVDIDYINGTINTIYTSTVDIKASGYMGKSFTNNTNMTNVATYDGYNTINVFGNLFSYKSNQAVSFTFDAFANGIVDSDKIVDVLYYQPWGIWNGQTANINVTLNGEEIEYTTAYTDQKGFGSYDFPYGLYVYNITDKILIDNTNDFNIAPIPGTTGYSYFYGGYIVVIYENSTKRTSITISEDCDALSAATTSSYGATPETAISYANYNNISTTDITSAKLIVMANNANTVEYVYINDNQKSLLKDYYNTSSQVSIAAVDVTNDITTNNTVAIKCVQDTSVYVLTSILFVEYDEPEGQIIITDVTPITFTNNVLVNQDNIINITISNENKEVTADMRITIDGESTNITITQFKGNQTIQTQYIPLTPGEKNIKIEVTYSNGTTEIIYDDIIIAYYNGYMGKSFNDGENFTTQRTYLGKNSFILHPFEFYKSTKWQEFSLEYDAVSNGIINQDDIVDVLYYQGYNWNTDFNIQIKVNDVDVDLIAQYEDSKGFASYNYPSGLLVYNLTNAFKANDNNIITISPIESNNNALYGGYLVIIYANNSFETTILINEGADLLNPESSGYGADASNTIAYSNYDEIIANNATLYTIVAAAEKEDSSKIIVNGKEYGSLADNYDSVSRLSIVKTDVDNLIDGENLVALQSIDDNLFAMCTVLVISEVENPQLVIEQINAKAGETITLKATITGTNNIINTGKISFKINGKTIKDENGKVIYAKIVNNTAQINYTVPEIYNNKQITIEATYSGSKDCVKLQNTTNITIADESVNIQTNNISTTYGQDIILKANITLSGNPISNGKVTFKINGKTVKDANGKTIYITVINGTATLSYDTSNLKSGIYEVTCIFTSSQFERAEKTSTLTIA